MKEKCLSSPRRNSSLCPICYLHVAALLFAFIPASDSFAADKDKPATKKVVSTMLRPERRPVTPELLYRLKTPDGFKVGIFARDLENPRMMMRLPDGGVFVTRFDQGDVLLVRDRDGDGVVDERKTVARIKEVHGMALRDGAVYLASTTKLFRAPLQEGGTLAEPIAFGELPAGGQHPRRTIGFGPDGTLFVSIGSTCNDCHEMNPEHATIVRMNADGSARRVFAKGLRNTIGFDWHPVTKEFWGMDHGSDHRGDDVPGEELNQIREGADYGWPWCYNRCEVDPITNPPAQGTKAQRCQNCVSPALLYQAHAAPIAFVFYTGEQFPSEYRSDAFVAFHGSWNRTPAVGYKVARVRFKDGKPDAFEDFLTGFLVERGKAHFGRPAGLAVAADGALLVSDDANGMIYRITNQKSGSK